MYVKAAHRINYAPPKTLRYRTSCFVFFGKASHLFKIRCKDTTNFAYLQIKNDENNVYYIYNI